MKTHHPKLGLPLIAAWLALPAAFVFGDDLLSRIPADSAAVIVIRNPAVTAARIDSLGRKIATIFDEPQGDPVSVERLLGRLGIEPGWCDTNKPVALILMQADLEQPRLAVAFTRAADRFEGLSKSPDGAAVKPLRGKGAAHGFGMRSGEQVFISMKAPVLERMAGLSPDKSLDKTLSLERRQLFEGSDIWLHGEIQPWMPRAEAMLDQLVMFAKLISTMRPNAAESSTAVFDWMLDGVKAVVHQMTSMDVALRIDSEGIGLTHWHEFTPGGSVAEYLAQGSQSKLPLLRGLPDVPFLVAVGSDWHGGESMQLAILQKLASSPAAKINLKDENVQKLRKTLHDWNADVKASNFMLATGRKKSLPVEMYASYECGDVNKSLERLAAMQCATQEMMDFLPGMGCAGKLEETTIDGLSVREVKMDFSRLDANTRRGIDMMYGRKARFLMAKLGDNRLGYVLSRHDESISQLAKVKPESDLTQNPRIKRIQAQLAAHPHELIIFNLTQAMSMTPELAAAGSPTGMVPPQMAHIRRNGRDALLGWSLRLEKNAARGDLYISNEDIFRFMRTVKSFSGGQDEEETPASQPSEGKAGK